MSDAAAIALRLFTVFWWTLLIVVTFFAISIILEIIDGHPWYMDGVHPWSPPRLLFSLLVPPIVIPIPFVILAIVRWIVTSRWRFGPSW